LGIEVAAFHAQLEDDMWTACSTRHAKKQHLADHDDDQSEITYINVGTNIRYGSHAMMMSPGFDSGWDNDMSSKGTMEAELSPEDASTIHHTIPMVSPPTTIPFSPHLMMNVH
jgi:hypothetical protein